MAGALSEMPLPPLREDLRLLPGPRSRDGAPTWTVHDPARHRFLRLGWLEFEILTRWALGRSDRVAHAVAAETVIRAGERDVLQMLAFADRAGLLQPTGEAGAKRLRMEAERRRLSAAMWLLKNYLFLRIRLLNPDRALAALLRLLGFVFTRGFVVGVALAAVLAGFLVWRQWPAYTHNFMFLFTLQGAALAALALSFAKVVHELGHGLTARHFGCRVPAMGVGLLVLWPVLWTDTTDAWRLTDRRQRMLIDAAGVAAEIVLAVAATLAWCVLADGPLRSGAFMLSSSTWLLTIVVNVNPMMRFDGYYLLSDLLDVPNLQDRGFALTRWRLRELLFGLGDPPPERFPPGLARMVLVYGTCTLIYRFVLFMGIALLVYHLAFKALGLFLMIVELGWFVVWPICGELRVWARRAGGMRVNRHTLATAVGLAALLAALLLPWHTQVSAPALLRAGRQAVLATGERGRLVRLVPQGQTVAEGTVVAELDSPQVTYGRRAALLRIAGLREEIAGAAFDPDRSGGLEVSWRELEDAVAKLRAFEAQEAALLVRAPFAGEVLDIPPDLRPGTWLPRRERLGLLVERSRGLAEAYVEETDIARVHVGAPATFVPDGGGAAMAMTVAEIGPTAIRALDSPDLASLHGGGVAVRKDASGALVPQIAVYRVVLRPVQADAGVTVRQRGAVAIEGDRVSLLGRIARRAAALFVRESGL